MRLVGDRSVQVGARLVLTFVPRECPVLSAPHCWRILHRTDLCHLAGTIVCLSNVVCFKACDIHSFYTLFFFSVVC
jgi:hypothetical protein